jgi:hypothetical protein
MASQRQLTWVGIAGLILVSQFGVGAGAHAGTSADSRTAATSHAARSPAWLTRINHIRHGSGLPPVKADSAWTKGIRLHLRYLGKTSAKYETGQYASAHTENPKSPYYTKAGAREGGRSDLAFYDSPNDVAAINVWLAAPFHAIGMIRPGLTKVAFFRDKRTGAAGLDVIGGLAPTTRTKPVLYPGPGSTIDLAAYNEESPSPIETCNADQPHANYGAPGLPLIVLLTAAPARNLSVTLKNPKGKTSSSKGKGVCMVDERNFTSSDPIYGPTGREILAGDHAVLIIPRTRLKSGRYSVDVSQSKQPSIKWSFTCHPAGHKHKG